MRHGVLIHLPAPGTQFGGLYHHCELALAEGLRAHGIPVYGTQAYWQDQPGAGFTIPRAPEGFGADLHIHTAYDLSIGLPPPESFRLPGLHVVLDWNDGEGAWLAGPHATAADLVLRTHFRNDIGYRDNVRPWAFGLTNRLIHTLAAWPSVTPTPSINWNFRHDHNLRRLVRRRLPAELLHHYPLATRTDLDAPSGEWLQQQTRGRHHPAYFHSLQTHRITAAFGGNFRLSGPIAHRLAGKIRRRARMEIVKFQLRIHRQTAYDAWLDFVEARPKTYQIFQTDSWRWWESLLSASVPLHLDLESHGWMLPVMPINGGHYLGLRAWDYQQFTHDILNREASSYVALAEAGRDWALEHYAPASCASRLLNWLGMRVPSATRPSHPGAQPHS
jgi:hypothetical protein